MQRRTILLATLAGALCLWLIVRFDSWSSASSEPGLAPAAESRRESRLDPALPPAAAASSSSARSSATEADKSSWIGSGELPGLCSAFLDSEPIAGVAVEFLREEVRIASAVSDEAGEFRVQISSGGFDDVQVRAPSGWWCVRQELQDAVYVVRLAPAGVGPLHARLVDDITSSAIPEYVVRVRSESGWTETLRSDGAGRIRSETLFPRGQLSLLRSEDEFGELARDEKLAEHEHVPMGAKPPLATIRIEVGPTFRLRIENPGAVPLAQLGAFLVPLGWVDGTFEFREMPAALHMGELPWVRFRELRTWMEEPHLVVADTRGQWFGIAPVTTLSGTQAEVVDVRLERMLRLRGRVIDSAGNPVARAQLQLSALGSSVETDRRTAESNGHGLFIIDSVRPGQYELYARHPRAGMSRDAVDLRESPLEDLAVQLEPYAVAGDVAGVLRSFTGEFQGPVTLVLAASVENREAEQVEIPTRTIRVVWKLVGASYEYPFRFEGVAHGSYILRASLRGAPYEVQPAERKVRPPEEAIELVVLDDKERYKLHFVVLDAVTSEWIEEARIKIMDGKGQLAFEGPAVSMQAVRYFVDGEPMTWKVTHPGYHAQFGDHSQVDKQTGNQNRVVFVRLKKD